MIRLPRLTWPQRAAVAAGIAVVALVGGLAGPASAHTSTAGFTNVHCLDNGAWSADLHITATNPELNPQATVTGPDSPFTIPVPPGGATRTFITNAANYTVGVTLRWSDGVTNNLGKFTATRPTGCVTPTTTTAVTTSTTTTTPPPPTTTVTSAPASVPSTEPPVTSVAGPPISPLPSTGSSPTSTPAISPTHTANLPATGASDVLLLLVAIGLFLVVIGILLRSAKQEHNG